MHLSGKIERRILFCFVLLGLCLTGAVPGGSAAPASSTRGWWPQAYAVQRDDAAGTLTVSTPYYTFQHDLKRGGALSKVALTHGRAANLLLRPVETRIQLARPDGGAAAEAGAPGDRFSDVRSARPSVEFKQAGKNVTVTVNTPLTDEQGRASGIEAKTVYEYRWGYVKIHKELRATRPSLKVRNLCLLSTVLDPSLSSYGYRPGVIEEMGPNPHSWQTGQIRRWGRIRPGTHLDLPFQTRHLPRYLVLADPGREGIEWFMSDDLSQWDFQMTGKPGDGFCEVSASVNPPGVAVSIFPVDLSPSFVLPKGGSVPLNGTVSFDYYLAVPILEGRASNPWLHQSFRGLRDDTGAVITSEQIKQWAADGVREMTVHNDGDRFKDGLFWRDGSYPPYPPEIMKKMDANIALVHEAGIRIAPYFSNHELHQSTEAFKAHGEEWGRKPDDVGSLRPNTYYGAHMCFKSGWLDFFKSSVDLVLKNHPFDGVYYDWNIAMFCNNPLHVGKTSNGVPAETGVGGYAVSNTGHWDIDELINLSEWTRERVGPEGLFIIHNTLVPMFVTENFASHVVGLEFTYGKLFSDFPGLEELPLEWNFPGSRPRGIIASGTIDRNAPRRIYKLHALAALMTNVTPWRANPETVELFKILRPLGDLEGYRFDDWRSSAVILDGRRCYSAVFSRAGEAYLLLANFNSEPKTVICTVKPGGLPHLLKTIVSAEIIGSGSVPSLSPAKLTGPGESILLPAEGALLLRLK
jgi:hypothetical protein